MNVLRLDCEWPRSWVALPVHVRGDNRAANDESAQKAFGTGMKDVDVRIKYMSEMQEIGLFEVTHVFDNKQLADGLTKVQKNKRFAQDLRRLGFGPAGEETA